MSKNRSQNVLLVEIMIAVLFFALSSTVILEVFVGAREYSRRSAVKSDALLVMQDTAARIYAAEDSGEALLKAGFAKDGAVWYKDGSDYRLELTLEEHVTGAGLIREWHIAAQQEEKVIAEIPGARYIPGGMAE